MRVSLMVKFKSMSCQFENHFLLVVSHGLVTPHSAHIWGLYEIQKTRAQIPKDSFPPLSQKITIGSNLAKKVIDTQIRNQ